MKTVIITGSSGLIGSEAVQFFSEKGMRVIGVDNDMRREFFGEEASTEWNRKRLEEEFKDLICSVWLELVSKDAWTECSTLYLQLAHRVLDCHDHPKKTFGEEWKNEFRSALGYPHSAKTSRILEEQMNIVIKETGRTPKFNPIRTRVKFLN